MSIERTSIYTLRGNEKHSYQPCHSSIKEHQLFSETINDIYANTYLMTFKYTFCTNYFVPNRRQREISNIYLHTATGNMSLRQKLDPL